MTILSCTKSPQALEVAGRYRLTLAIIILTVNYAYGYLRACSYDASTAMATVDSLRRPLNVVNEE